MRNKKIVYVGNFELPDKDAAAQRVLGIGKALRDCDNSIYFVGADKEYTKNFKSKNIIDTKKDVQGFVTFVRPYPENGKDWIRYITDIEPYVRVIQEIKRVDVLICYNFSAILLVKLKRYCHSKDIQCIADVTEWYSITGRKFPMNIVKGIDEFFRMRVVQKHLDGLIVISRYLEHYYRKCSNVICIPPLVDFDEEKWNNPYDKEKNVLKIVYAGVPGRKDRIDILIDALKGLCRQYHLDVIGITEDEYTQLYSRYKKGFERNSNIIFHGRLPHKDTLDFVKKANYSCFFRDINRTTMAGFPTKLVEAISCGTPVITNNTSNISEYIKKENGILINYTDIKRIRSVLEKAGNEYRVKKTKFAYSNYIQALCNWMESVK